MTSPPEDDPDAGVSLRYMTRFSCLADRCEDACCEHWTVEVDEASFRRMQAQWTPADGQGRPFEELVVLNPQRRGPKNHGLMKLGDDGACQLLEKNRLCGMHLRHGADVLSNACALFPRSLQRHGGRVEMAGSLACPEAARLCLLALDAVEIVPAERDVLLRPEAARPIEARAGKQVAHAALVMVRQHVTALLHDEVWPWRTRLCLLAHLADRLDPLLVDEGTSSPGEVEKRLDAVRQELTASSTLEARLELHHWFHSRTFPLGPPLATLSAWLLQRTQLPHGARFSRLAEGLRASYGPDQGNPEALAGRYEVRRAEVEARFSHRLLQYFRNYTLNAWFRDPFSERSSLGDYVWALLLRLGMLRHLLFAQPQLEELCTGDDRPPRPREVARLDALAVEVVQAFSKDVEHTPAFLELLAQARQGGTCWGQSVLYAAL